MWFFQRRGHRDSQRAAEEILKLRQYLKMSAKSDYHRKTYGELENSLSQQWERLCAHYLPIYREDSIWRFNRGPIKTDAEQGWKLHVSATVLTANEVLRTIGPLLQTKDVRFKAPSSLHELQKINSGLSYGYSQVGKFITVYPPSTDEAFSLADRIHQLTSQMNAPSVPFDLQFRPDSCVYYRYGSFKHVEMKNADGTRTLALRHPEGRLVPDLRQSVTARPDWISDPFAQQEIEGKPCRAGGPLSAFRAFQSSNTERQRRRLQGR